MHMGGLVSTAHFSSNFVHVLVNNGVHESVGGQPTLIDNVDVKILRCLVVIIKPIASKQPKSLIRL